MISSPIHLPELVLSIVKPLEQQDLVSCVLVCKSWHATFIPYLYHSVVYTINYLAATSFSASQAAFQKHGHHMRVLSVHDNRFPSLDLFGPGCRHLTALHIYPVGLLPPAPLETWERPLVTLLQQNPNIETFTLSLHPQPLNLIDDHFSRMKIFRFLPAVKTLILPHGYFTEEDTFVGISKLGPQLERLEYGLTWHQFSSNSSQAGDTNPCLVHDENHQKQQQDDIVIWPNVRTLELECSGGTAVNDILRCSPFVENLHVKFRNARSCFTLLQEMVQQRRSSPQGLNHYPSRLQSLEMNAVLGDAAITALTDLLRVSGESIGLKTFRMTFPSSVSNDLMLSGLLQYHASSLEHFMIRFCSDGPDSSSVQALLASCPRLKSFELFKSRSTLFMEDIVRSPWVCADLELFKVHIAEGAGSQPPSRGSRIVSPKAREWPPIHEELQRQIWNQIGKMRHLRVLSLHTSVYEFQPILCMRVGEGGYNQLLQLSKLQLLIVPEERHLLGDELRKRLQEEKPGLQIVDR